MAIKDSVDREGDAIAPTSQFLASLVAARGLAALMVAGFHCGQSRWTGGDLLLDTYDREHSFWGWLNQIAAIALNGHAAVIFFFALSGFVLTYSSTRLLINEKKWWKSFLIRRIFRIYPAVIATVGIFVVTYRAAGLALPGLESTSFATGEVLLNMLLIHTSINGVMWSLRVEVLAMPAVMLGIFLARHNRGKLLFPLALTMTSLHFWSTWRESVGSQFAFVFGAIACIYGRRFVTELACRKSIFGCSALLGILLPRCILGASSLWSSVIEGVGAACLVSYLAYSQQGLGSRLLHNKWLLRLGEVSYSFYLLHPLCLLYLWRAEPEIEALRELGIPSVVLVLAMTACSTCIVVPLAWLLWHVVEVPWMRLGRMMADLRNTHPHAAGQMGCLTPDSPFGNRRVQVEAPP